MRGRAFLTTVDRTIARSLLKGFALVMLVLVGLFSVAALVQELEDVGKGSYRLGDALHYIASTIPGRSARLAPICGLLGGIFGLGALAARREVLAMRSLGQSMSRCVAAATVTGLLLMIGLGIVVEFIAPFLEREAGERRRAAIGEAPTIMTQRGLWLRDGSRLARIGEVKDAPLLRDLEIFELDDAGRLQQVIRADEAEILDGGRWRLRDFVATPVDSPLEGGAGDRLDWNPDLDVDELELLLREPRSLSLGDLHRVLDVRRRRGHDYKRFEFIFWRKLLMPLETLLMILLSMPFVLGPFLTEGLGARVKVGAITGVSAYLLSEISGYAGLVLRMDPRLTAVIPLVIIVSVAACLLARIR